MKLHNKLTFWKKKRIVITGAASGIGMDLASVLSEAGADLALIDIQITKLSELKKNCKGNTGDIYLYQADVSSAIQMEAATKDILSRWERTDIVIAAAGVGGINPGATFSKEIDRRIMSINYFGTVNTFIPFVTQMKKTGSGQLVGISSLAAFRGLPGGSSYSASKSAQTRLIESLRIDLRPFGISVSSIHPGFVETPMANHGDFKMPFKVSIRNSTSLILNSIQKQKSQFLYPWQMKWLTKLNAFIPNFFYDRVMPFISGNKSAIEAKLLSSLNEKTSTSQAESTTS